MTTPADDEEWSELTDFHPNRVDLVKNAANGTRFLIAKQDASAGVLDPDFVRGLISKSEPDPAPREVTMPTTLPNGITLTGSPADVAAFIHKATTRQDPELAAVAKARAEYEQIVKAKYSAEDRRKMGSSGAAMPDGSYPIADEADLKNAIHAVGRGSGSHNAIRKHIIKRAKSLGKSSLIPDNWNSDGSVKESVSKDALDLDAATPDEEDLDNGVDGLDPTVPFAAPDEEMPGDPTDPGSPAWEAIDAATAQKWLSILARAQNAIELLSDREGIEAATADPDDAQASCALQDAADTLDYVIGQLAVFAAGEQAEADLAAEAMEAVGKAVGGAEAPLGVLEGFAAVRKAGRVLSSANEAKIRQAAQSLNDVLASLPQAPDSGQPVAKEKEGSVPETQETPAAEVTKNTDTPDEVAKETAPDAGERPEDIAKADVVKEHPGVVRKGLRVAIYDHAGQLAGLVAPDKIGDRIAKADGDDGPAKLQAVFDEDGCLIGVCDPADIQAVSGAGGGSDDDSDDDGPDGDDDSAADQGDDAAGDDSGDLEPQPSADAGVPATDEDVTKTTAGGQAAGDEKKTDAAQDVLKSIARLTELFESNETARNEVVAKMADGNAELVKELEVLKARLETVEGQPAMPKVITNGAVPPAHMMRGQDQGGIPANVDIAKAQERKRELYMAPDARRQNEVAQEMQGDAIAALAAIHGHGGR